MRLSAHPAGLAVSENRTAAANQIRADGVTWSMDDRRTLRSVLVLVLVLVVAVLVACSGWARG